MSKMDAVRGPAEWKAAIVSQPGPHHLGRLRISAPKLQVVAIALCGVLLVSLVFSYMRLLQSGAAGISQTDFIAYYSGAHFVLAGHGDYLYSFRALGAFEAHLVFPLRLRDGVLPYVYPPFFAVLLAPFGALTFPTAYGLWLLINGLLLAVTTAALDRYAGLATRGRLLLWISFLSFLPVSVCLIQGQTSLLILALVTTVFFSLRTSGPRSRSFTRDLIGGVALALALIKPPLVIPFVITLLLRRRLRPLAVFAGAAACLFAVPAVTLGWASNKGYAQVLLQAARWRDQFGYAPQLNHSIAGFAELLLPSSASTLAATVLVISTLTLLAFAAIKSPDSELVFGVSAVDAVLISPHVLVHDLSVLLLPLAVALRHRDRAPLQLTMILTLGYLAIFIGLRSVAVIPLQLSVPAMSALVLWMASCELRSRYALSACPVSASDTIVHQQSPIPAHSEEPPCSPISTVTS